MRAFPRSLTGRTAPRCGRRRYALRNAPEMTQASLLEEVESCSTSVLSSRAGANRDGRNYVTGASQSVGRRRVTEHLCCSARVYLYRD